MLNARLILLEPINVAEYANPTLAQDKAAHVPRTHETMTILNALHCSVTKQTAADEV